MAALVLAAGRGSRFGEAPKLLAALHGKPLVRHAAEAALEAGCAPVLVVTGHRGPDIRAALRDLPLTFVDNPDHPAGLSTSLRAGMAALPASAAGALVLLGDMPRISAALIRALVAGWEEHGRPDALVPTYAGRRGNPVLLSRRLAPEIATLSGDAGAGPLLRARAGVVELPVADASVTVDVDTPDALRSAAAQPSTRTTPSSTAE